MSLFLYISQIKCLVNEAKHDWMSEKFYSGSGNILITLYITSTFHVLLIISLIEYYTISLQTQISIFSPNAMGYFNFITIKEIQNSLTSVIHGVIITINTDVLCAHQWQTEPLEGF